MVLRHREVVERLTVRLQPRPVRFIRREAVKGDQAPRHVIGPLVRHEVAHEMAAASRNDAAPILSVLFEPIALKWIDLVADDAGHGHGDSPVLIGSVPVVQRQHFVYDETMDAAHPEIAVARIAAAIGEPARARMLYALMDGHARTSTELAVIGGVSASTASVHLSRLKAERLVKVLVQGKHRYYSIEGSNVAAALEALDVVAGRPRGTFVPTTPTDLRAARTCYDHMAGAVAVALHDRLKALNLITARGGDEAYDLTGTGVTALEALGVDVTAARALRRRFAFACLDWSERRPHLGGAIGAAVLQLALERKWVLREYDSRALTVTPYGRREMAARFGVR